jgi:drug/metabolite transporter (DMT)-like permease
MSIDALDRTPPRRPPTSAYVIAALPALFWAGNFVVGRLMNASIPPMQFSFWRWTLAWLILTPIAWPAVRANASQMRRELPWLILLGLIGITAFNTFLYSALRTTTVVNGTLINALSPVLTFLLAVPLLGQRLRQNQIVGILLSILGAAVIIVRGEVGALAQLTFNRGDLLVLAGTACWSLYTVLIGLRRTRLPPFVFLWAIIGIGVLFHLPLIAVARMMVGGFDLTWATAAALVYVSVFASVASYGIWNRSVAVLGPGLTGMSMHLIPVFASVLAVLFLGERFAWFHAVGILLIAAGIALVLRQPPVPTTSASSQGTPP